MLSSLVEEIFWIIPHLENLLWSQTHNDTLYDLKKALRKIPKDDCVAMCYGRL